MTWFDVAVIGGGTVGCAILHELTLKGYKCVLLEKNDHLLMGASCGNSGILASGFDTDPSTMEGKCLTLATALNETVYKKYNIPRGNPGAIVCAFTESELRELPSLLVESERSGTVGCHLLSSKEIQMMEPNITRDIKGGMWVPGERALEPWLLPITLAHVAKHAGAKVLTSCEVVSGKRIGDDVWELHTTQGRILAAAVVNAGGLYGDRVEAISHRSQFRIQPRQGDFVVYNQAAGQLVNHILLPVPTARTKGVLIFLSVHGHLVVGPTANDVDSRIAPSVSTSTADMLVRYAERVIPALTHHVITGTYAGLRPATEHQDYCIKHYPDRGWVAVGGIRSTGLSACLAIASHTEFLLQHALGMSPSCDPPPGTDVPVWRRTGESVEIGGESYHITHPLTKLGLPLTSRL